jgi:hypothetical protein
MSARLCTRYEDDSDAIFPFACLIATRLKLRATPLFQQDGQVATLKDTGSQAFILTSDCEEEMLRADVDMAEPFRFLGGAVEDALIFLAQRHFRVRGNAFANLVMRFDFLAIDAICACQAAHPKKGGPQKRGRWRLGAIHSPEQASVGKLGTQL